MILVHLRCLYRVQQPWAPPSQLSDPHNFPSSDPHWDPKPVEVFNVILEAIVSIEQPQGILQLEKVVQTPVKINIASLLEEIEQ